MLNTGDPHRYAIILRTHFWDDFVERQLGRLKAATTLGDIFILVDETGGHVAGLEDKAVFRVKSDQFPALGLPLEGEGAPLWFNGDYPLYPFRMEYPSYEYYVQLEYDVVVNGDLDALVAEAKKRGADFVGLTKGPHSDVWFWRGTCEGVYDIGKLDHQLICFSVFSGRALDLLYNRRRSLEQRLSSAEISHWPMCEAFIATELREASYTMIELSEFGNTQLYDHWPPFVESDLNRMKGYEFIHPLLDTDRYTSSVLKNAISLKEFVNPFSLTHRKLRRLTTKPYILMLFGAKVRAAFAGAVDRKLLHLRQGHLLTPKSELRA